MLMDEKSMFTCQPPPAYLTVEHLLPGEPRHPVRVTESEGQPLLLLQLRLGEGGGGRVDDCSPPLPSCYSGCSHSGCSHSSSDGAWSGTDEALLCEHNHGQEAERGQQQLHSPGEEAWWTGAGQSNSLNPDEANEILVTWDTKYKSNK